MIPLTLSRDKKRLSKNIFFDFNQVFKRLDYLIFVFQYNRLDFVEY